MKEERHRTQKRGTVRRSTLALRALILNSAQFPGRKVGHLQEERAAVCCSPSHMATHLRRPRIILINPSLDHLLPSTPASTWNALSHSFCTHDLTMSANTHIVVLGAGGKSSRNQGSDDIDLVDADICSFLSLSLIQFLDSPTLSSSANEVTRSPSSHETCHRTLSLKLLQAHGP